jgi:hypothetical protein
MAATPAVYMTAHSPLAGLGPLVTVAILAHGTHWVVAVTQAFFEKGRRQLVILQH